MSEALNFVFGGIGLFILLAGTVFWIRRDLKRVHGLKSKLRMDGELTPAEREELSFLLGKYPWVK